MAAITEPGAQLDSGLVNGSRNSDFYGVKSEATAIYNADFTALCWEDLPVPGGLKGPNLGSGRVKYVHSVLVTLRQMCLFTFAGNSD